MMARRLVHVHVERSLLIITSRERRRLLVHRHACGFADGKHLSLEAPLTSEFATKAYPASLISICGRSITLRPQRGLSACTELQQYCNREQAVSAFRAVPVEITQLTVDHQADDHLVV